MSPEEQQLAGDLQTASAVLESHEKSTSSSTDSEARDSLKEREAEERSLEFIRRHCPTDARVSPPGSQGPSSGKGSGSRTQNTMRGRTSARVLGLAGIRGGQGQGDPGEKSKVSSRSKESSSPSATTSEKDANASSSSGDHARHMTTSELTDKIAKLEQSIITRDAEAATMLQNCEDIEEAGIIALARVKEELAAAVFAKEKAEKQRNKLETAAAGDKARYDNNMAYEREQNAAELAKSERQAEDLVEAALELAQARADLAKSRENADIDETHALASSKISAERIKELEKALAAVKAQLAAAFEREKGKEPAGSDAERERGLRHEINELEEERQETNKQMSSVRLELLGLKRDQERRRVETGQTSGQPSSTTRPGPGRQRGQAHRKGKGRSLEIIDEEDDDVPDTRSLDNADLASECVSSDHETDSAADATAQRDLVNKLLKQLVDQKKFMQELKAEHAGSSAEQLEQIQQLMVEMSENNILHETMAAEHELLKKKEKFNRLDHLKKVDILQQTMRAMQGRLDDQEVKMQEQDRTAVTSELNTTNLEEQLQLQTEALRITSLRLQDALQQHENDSLRNKQEQNSLRLQLAAEKRKMGDFSTPEVAEMSIEEIQDQRIKDLQEERNILIGRIELKDVQFQLQIEELHREYAIKMQEQQRRFADRMAELRAAPGAFHQAAEISSMPVEALGSSGPAGLVTAAAWQTSQPIHGQEAIDGVASSQSHSECEGTGTETSASSQSPFSGLKGLIWNILCLLPNVAALLCSEEGAIIQNITQRVGILLGSNLMGKSFYSLVKEKNLMSLQRTIMENQAVTDGQEYKAEDLSRTLARHQLEAPNGGPVDLLITALHFPGSGGERHILILLVEQPSERARNQQSVASSDICPSDSVSVNRRRPQLMRTEVQRTKLRASFFSTRQSQRDAESSASSPRSSWLR